MSILAYLGQYHLYHLLDEANDAEKSGDYMDYDEFMCAMKKEIELHSKES